MPSENPELTYQLASNAFHRIASYSIRHNYGIGEQTRRWMGNHDLTEIHYTQLKLL